MMKLCKRSPFGDYDGSVNTQRISKVMSKTQRKREICRDWPCERIREIGDAWIQFSEIFGEAW